MFLLIAAAAMAAQPPNRAEFVRDERHQVMHLDVATKAEARAIRMAVLNGWSRSANQDVIIEPMADAAGHRFYCVRLSGQEE